MLQGFILRVRVHLGGLAWSLRCGVRTQARLGSESSLNLGVPVPRDGDISGQMTTIGDRLAERSVITDCFEGVSPRKQPHA